MDNFKIDMGALRKSLGLRPSDFGFKGLRELDKKVFFEPILLRSCTKLQQLLSGTENTAVCCSSAALQWEAAAAQLERWEAAAKVQLQWDSSDRTVKIGSEIRVNRQGL